MRVVLLETLTPLGGEPIPEGTVVEARRAMDRNLEVVGHGWLPLNFWEWQEVSDEEAEHGRGHG